MVEQRRENCIWGCQEGPAAEKQRKGALKEKKQSIENEVWDSETQDEGDKEKGDSYRLGS